MPSRPQPYPNLEQLFGGYFHQDWRAEFKGVDAAARAFVGGNAQQVRAALDELRNLTSTHRGSALGKELEKLGCAAHGQAPEAFAAEVERVLTGAAKESDDEVTRWEASFQFVPDPGAWHTEGLIAHISGAGTDKKALLDQIAKGLGLPAYFGRNWDALEESLRDLSWAKGAKALSLVHDTVPEELSAHELRTYLDLLAGAVTNLRAAHDEGAVLNVVFPAAERARMRKRLA